MTNSATKRNGTIDLLKFIFTIMVMLFHTNYLVGGGYIAVDFFFIVSGFLMAKSMQKRLENGVPLGTDTISFVLHKAKGIFPYYFVAWLMSFIVTILVSGSAIKSVFETLFRSVFNIFMTEMSGNYDMGHRLQASWYISAMLLAILVIYPIRKKFTDVFDRVIAPIVFLVFVGMAYQSGAGVSGFTVGYKSDLYVYNGIIRGIAEISLGCICFNVSKKLTQYSYTPLGGICLSIVEWFGYGTVFYFAYNTSKSDIDIAMLPLIALSVAISFSGKSLFDKVFTHKVFTFLGSFSLQMYFTHELVKNVIIPYLRNNTNISLFKNRELGIYLGYYIVLTIIAAIICRLLGNALTKGASKIYPKMKRILIKQ